MTSPTAVPYGPAGYAPEPPLLLPEDDPEEDPDDDPEEEPEDDPEEEPDDEELDEEPELLEPPLLDEPPLEEPPPEEPLLEPVLPGEDELLHAMASAPPATSPMTCEVFIVIFRSASRQAR